MEERTTTRQELEIAPVVPENTIVAQNEPILKKNPKRFMLFPIQHDDIWQFHKKQQANLWTAENVDLFRDLHDWKNKLNNDEKYFIKHILAFLATNETLVNNNLTEHFLNLVKYPEAKSFYGFQVMMENVHSETYSLLFDSYLKDAEEKDYLLNAIDTFPPVRKKAEWSSRWINKGTFAERLIASAVVEGIFCSGIFCSVLSLKKRNLMPGLTTFNELISRDKGIQQDFVCSIYNNHLINKLSKEKVTSIITDAVNIEIEFVTESLPVSLIGTNVNLISQYIHFIADKLLVQLGCDKVYNASNPFEFMDMFSLQKEHIFFGKKTSRYKSEKVINGAPYLTKEFSLDEIF